VGRLRALLRKPADRRESGLVAAEGCRTIRAALEAGAVLQEIYIGPGGDLSLTQALGEGGIARSVTWEGLETASSTRSPQPEIALFRQPAWTLDDLRGDPVVVGVDIQDPGNAGSLIRNAVALGAAGVVFCGNSVDAYSPKTVRSSAGAAFALPVVAGTDTSAALDHLRRSGLSLLATDGAAESSLFEEDLRGPTAVILGNEGAGLSEEVIGACDRAVRIPIEGAESLNVASASAVMLFELRRQRSAAP
jgi:RNA methyltransferase, TrmH family